MIADSLPTDRASASPMARRTDPPHLPSRGPRQRPGVGGDLAATIPSSAAVLWLGPIDEEAARELEERSCRLSPMTTSDRERPDTTHMQVAELDRLDLGRARFDAIVAADVLGRVASPEALLDALRIALRSGGQLVVTVPNAAHASVQNALSQGRSPYAPDGPLDTGQVRLFTRESLSISLEDVGFVVARLEEIETCDEPSFWRAVAYPLPVPGLDTIQDRFREHAEAREEAEREARLLRHLLDQTAQALDSAHRRAEELIARDRASLAARLDAEQALLERDEEFRATIRDLLNRLDEVEPLRRERDAAHRHALAAEERCRALELRIEHVLMELPRRVLRKAKRIVRGH